MEHHVIERHVRPRQRRGTVGGRLGASHAIGIGRIGINRIGMVISDPASALLNLSLLGDFLTLRFYNDGEEVDSATVGGGLLGLELLGLSLDSDERFLSAEVDTNELTFDEVQLDYAGLLNVNGSLRVHRVCAGNDPEDAP